MRPRRGAAVESAISGGRAAARVLPDRVARELGIEALAHEHAKRPLAVAGILAEGGKAADEQVQCGGALVVVRAGANRGRDMLIRDPELTQAALDALGPPAVQRAAVLREPGREARVVDVALAPELGDGGLGGVVPDAAAREMAAHLALGPVPLRQVAIGQIERVLLALGFGRRRPVAVQVAGQAACSSSGATGPASSSTGAIGVTESWSMPSAA